MPQLLPELIGHDRSQLDDRIAVLTLTPPGPDHDAGVVQRQLGRVEEEDLPHLRVERIDAQRRAGAGPGGLGQRELQLDAVGTLDEREDLGQFLVCQVLERGLGVLL